MRDIHFFFENRHFRALLAFLMCVVLAFSDSIGIFKELWMYYVLCGLAVFMVFTDAYNDFGLVLLLIAMAAMSATIYGKEESAKQR